MTRILSLSILVCTAFFLPTIVILPVALFYAIWFQDPYELIAIAVFFDLVFGVAAVFPLYTLGAVVLVGFSLMVRPYLTFITKR